MENECISTCREGYKDDFIYRVLGQFSRWGIDVNSILNMLEISADDKERFDVIKDCLDEFGRFPVEPESFLGEDTSEDYNVYAHDASITLECRDLLDELDEIRDGIMKSL